MRASSSVAIGLAALLGLGACASQKITEDTSAAVSVRYDGVVVTLEDATTTANRTCAAYGKVARLRENTIRAILERVAHFDCVSA